MSIETTPAASSPDTVWLPGDSGEKSVTAFAVAGIPDLRASIATGRDSLAPSVTERSMGDGIVEVTLESAPGDQGGFTASFLLPVVDGVSLWTPGSTAAHGSIPASWVEPRRTSPLRGLAAGSLLATDDRTVLTFAATAGIQPIAVRAGLVEESVELLVAFEVPAGTPSLTVLLDASHDAFDVSVARAGSWLWGGATPSSPASEKPVFCTWYFAHQDIAQASVLAQTTAAAEYGFGSLIIDDGWQTDERQRGYGSAGDWRPERGKLPDPRGLVREIEALGIRTLWWIGTPFLGYRSDSLAIDDLPTLFDEPSMEAEIIDLRSVRARRTLLGRLLDLVHETGAHGLKIDFLERFAAAAAGPAPADADFDEVEPAALAFLEELVERGRLTDPDFMIEFREPYIGPAAGRFATMLRVGDCPLSPLENRLGIVDLRLIAPGIAVHSDPIMWNENDSPERVAQHLANALFGVPQVSVDLLTISPEHSEVLHFWLDFWQANVDVLLHGSFTPRRPDLLYPLVEASAEGTTAGSTTIIGRYGPGSIELPRRGWNELHVVNADSAGVVVVGGDVVGAVDCVVRDARGRVVEERAGVQLASVERVGVPAGGLLTLTRG